MVSKEELAAIENELIDQSNRSRRNNIVLYNVPEGEEKGDVLGFVQDLIKNVIKLDEEIEVAHHTKSDKEGPWLIHARCLRRDSRNKILLAAPKAIKNMNWVRKMFILLMICIQKPGNNIGFSILKLRK